MSEKYQLENGLTVTIDDEETAPLPAPHHAGGKAAYGWQGLVDRMVPGESAVLPTQNHARQLIEWARKSRKYRMTSRREPDGKKYRVWLLSED